MPTTLWTEVRKVGCRVGWVVQVLKMCRLEGRIEADDAHKAVGQQHRARMHDEKKRKMFFFQQQQRTTLTRASFLSRP